MKRSKMIKALLIWAFSLCLSLLFFASETLAADNFGNWRPTYDFVMRWLNFVILAFLLVKFGKNPLMNMLRQRKEKLQREIKRAEEQRKNAAAKANEVRQKLDESVAYLEEIKQKIIKRGELRKQEIIQNAQQESKILIQEAKRRIDTQILGAKKLLQAEMIDEAMKIAFNKLPQQLNEEDNQKFLDQYLTGVLSE
jgi:F-type H+-transporting ATPase subunit b